MQIDLDNILARVSSATPEEHAWLYEYLSFEDMRTKFTRRRDGSTKVNQTRRLSLLALNDTFPAGMVRSVQKAAFQMGFFANVVDRRAPPCAVLPWEQALGAQTQWLHDFQIEAVDKAVSHTRGILDMPTGCHRRGQEVVMYDGTLRRIEDVVTGDTLMGPDSEPRQVLGVRRGHGEMAEIRPAKGTSFVVNLDHVLTLVRTGDGTPLAGKLVDVPVREWLSWSKTSKHVHKLLRRGYELPAVPLPVDPYVLGALLGDGCLTHGAEICTPDQEVTRAFTAEAERVGDRVSEYAYPPRCPVFHACGGALLSRLTRLGVAGKRAEGKRVPPVYLRGSVAQRLAILAGLLDTDGSLCGCFDFVSKSEQLAKDIVFLARSVGLAAYIAQCTKSCQGDFTGVYWRVSISGDLDRIPTRVPRKRAPPRRQKKDVCRVGFTVERLAVSEDFFGVSLDRDQRYLLASGEVTHNSGKTECAVGLAMRLGLTNTLFVVPEADLLHNAARRWEKRTNTQAGRIGDSWTDPRDGFTAATFQTLNARIAKRDPKVLAYLATVGCMIVDEVHVLPSDSFYRVAQAVPAYWRIGMSGTPLARGDRRSLFSIAATGPIIYRVPTQLLIERGFISKPHIRMVPCTQEGDAGTWQSSYSKFITGSRRRNDLIAQLAANAPKPGLVFVREKKHGHALTSALQALGVRVEFLWGEKSTGQRDAAIQRLRDGDLDLIVCSVVLQTGTDIPEVRSMVIAAGGKSEIATLQRIGRGMRIVRDDFGKVLKDEFWVFDVMDAEPTNLSGDTGNKWNAKHSRERFKSYTGVGHEVTIKLVT